jgi:hypothetical protein
VGLTVRHTRISTHARTSTHTSTHTHIHTHTHTHTHPSVHGEASSTRTATHAHHHSTQHTATTGSTGRCEQVGGRDRGGVGEPTVWEIELEQPHMSVQVCAVVKLKRTGLHECGGGGGWVGGVGQTHPARTIVQPRTRLFARIFRYCFVLNGGGGAIAVPTASMLPLFLVMISMRTVMSHELRRFISFDLASSRDLIHLRFSKPHAGPKAALAKSTRGTFARSDCDCFARMCTKPSDKPGGKRRCMENFRNTGFTNAASLSWTEDIPGGCG